MRGICPANPVRDPPLEVSPVRVSNGVSRQLLTGDLKEKVSNGANSGASNRVKAKRPPLLRLCEAKRGGLFTAIVINYLVTLEFVLHTQADPEFVLGID